MASLWIKLTTTTAEFIDKYPYALPVARLLFHLADTVNPIPEKEEVATVGRQKQEKYSKALNLIFPILSIPFWSPWAYKLYKMTKMDKPVFDIDSLSKIQKYGLIFGCIGTFIRFYSRAYLGNAFTYFIAIRKDHKLCISGPYAIVRNPGYVGTILIIFSDAMYFKSKLLFLWSLLMTKGIFGKINDEEKVLGDAFGEEYQAYKKKTKYKLLPYIY